MIGVGPAAFVGLITLSRQNRRVDHMSFSSSTKSSCTVLILAIFSIGTTSGYLTTERDMRLAAMKRFGAKR